jgi:hypothetical protein
MRFHHSIVLGLLFLSLLGIPSEGAPVIAEAERFIPVETGGWRTVHQEYSFASGTFGGMWVSQGAVLGAPPNSANHSATQTVSIPASGIYRVWSKYQSPSYLNFQHRIEIRQNDILVYSNEYGRLESPRFWSFSGAYGLKPIPQVWWTWGIDHDAAEAPATVFAPLLAGSAEIRLLSVSNTPPGDWRMVDFVVLTTNLTDTYQGWSPYQSASPFCLEAFAAQSLYLRFSNAAPQSARLRVTRAGHYNPDYSGPSTNCPATLVNPAEWSPWFNIGPFCRLVHNEGLYLTLINGSASVLANAFSVEFSRTADGSDPVGAATLNSSDVMNVPMTITWDTNAWVKPSRLLAQEIIALTNTWRTANNGNKPTNILFYGKLTGNSSLFSNELKNALGYNTYLPTQLQGVARCGMYEHCYSTNEIYSKIVSKLTPAEKTNFLIVSLGDEISLGNFDFNSANNKTAFKTWLTNEAITAEDLGMAVDLAYLTPTGDPRLVWYSTIFSEVKRFDTYKAMTQYARDAIGPHVLAGANYSPHSHMPLYYGPIYQWVDIFKHNGLSLYWTEDYIFTVPELPQIVSWMYATMRCAVKYNQQPMHFYVMPHAPSQDPDIFRRNTLLAIGNGVRHINNFWIAPQESFTENYVAWEQTNMFRAIHESIYDTAEAEPFLVGGTMRPARVAVVMSKATEFNESRMAVPKTNDLFMAICSNAPATVEQTIGRNDQQMLYLALRQNGRAVDLITEDDIAEGYLDQYSVVYFSGEWIDHRAIGRLTDWVNQGGILYAASGAGRFNEFGESATNLLTLLGLSGSTLRKDVAVIRTLQELPFLPPIGTITLEGRPLEAVGLRQEFEVTTAEVLGTWENGNPAVTRNAFGSGQAFAVGTLAGNTYMKTGVRPIGFARGGYLNLYNPDSFSNAARRLVRLGVEAGNPSEEISCSHPLVEATVIDNPTGTLVTLVNWSNSKIDSLRVSVKLPAAPRLAKSVTLQQNLPVGYADGWATFTVPLQDADYILLPNKKTGDAPFPYVWGKAFHILPETTSEESGYFSLCEGLNGNLYVGTAKYQTNAFLVEFNSTTETQRIVLDTAALCGLTATGYAAQAKIHTRNFVGPSGTIYVGSKQGYPVGGDTNPYPGGYLMTYDPATETARNLGMPMPTEGIIDVVADEDRHLIYIVTCEQQHWLVHNTQNQSVTELGPIGVSYATTLVDVRGVASLISTQINSGTGKTNFALVQFDPDHMTLTSRVIQVDGVDFRRMNNNSIPTWNLNPDRTRAYLILMNDPTLISIDLCSTGPVVTARSHGLMLTGTAPDSRSALSVAPDGKVFALVRVNNTTGYSGGGGSHYLHHLTSFDPQTETMTDHGVLAVKNPDFYAWKTGSPNTEPAWCHGFEKLPDGTITPRYNHMALVVTRDYSIYATLIYPYTLLRIDPWQLSLGADRKPFLINASAGPHGVLDPPGSVWVEPDDEITYSITADTFFHTDSIKINGAEAGPVATHTFTNLNSHQVFRAEFAPNLTDRGTPEWWLNQADLTNDSFTVTEDTDIDQDGRTAWQEWQADTDPNDPEDVLKMTGIQMDESGLSLNWKGGKGVRQYLEAKQDLSNTGTAWSVIYTNYPPMLSNQNLLDLASTNQNLFYRIRAER